MTDKELLEYAAKAAGIELGDAIYCDGEFCSFQINPGCWNPLTDDGDALRLAVKLGLLDNAMLNVWISSEVGMHGLDWYAATRRAIVRAAAEIGKRHY